jgi:hypothetical protein
MGGWSRTAVSSLTEGFALSRRTSRFRSYPPRAFMQSLAWTLEGMRPFSGSASAGQDPGPGDGTSRGPGTGATRSLLCPNACLADHVVPDIVDRADQASPFEMGDRLGRAEDHGSAAIRACASRSEGSVGRLQQAPTNIRETSRARLVSPLLAGPWRIASAFWLPMEEPDADAIALRLLAEKAEERIKGTVAAARQARRQAKGGGSPPPASEDKAPGTQPSRPHTDVAGGPGRPSR